MDDHRPVQNAAPDEQPHPLSFTSRDVATTGELLIERPLGRRWSSSVPSSLRSSWSGVGVWLGAMTVVGLAAMMFRPTLVDLAGESRPADSERSDEGAAEIGIRGDGGAPSGGDRGSRARTTGELAGESATIGPTSVGPGRASGPSGGLDLELGYRSGENAVVDIAQAAAGHGASPGGATPAAPAVDPNESTGGGEAVVGSTAGETVASTSSTTLAKSFPGSESMTTAPPITADEGAYDERTDGDTAEAPPTSRGPTSAHHRPTVTVTPPTTRKPVPADTRPSQGGGKGRGHAVDGRPGAAGSNGSDGRAVGRPH